MKKQLIHFIMTGGTIDSSWDTRQDSIVLNEKSDVPKFFRKFAVVDDLQFTHICMKDSRELTEEDLQSILQTVEKSESTKIIITHGRFTVIDTARFLKKKLKRHDQTIILTGGTTPLRGFEMSDSPFNLGFAIAKVQDHERGVFINIDGRLFTINEFDKYIRDGKSI